MKRAVSLLLSTALLFSLLCACQASAVESQPPADYEPTALDVINAVLPYCGYSEEAGDIESLTAENELLTIYIENAYGLAAGAWEDAAVVRGIGASAFELAVLRLADESAAVRAASSLMTYIFNRQKDFAGYAPDQENMVINGSINQNGPYAALFICPSTDSADAAFTSAIKGELLPELPSMPPDGPVEDVDELLALLVDECARWDDVSDMEWLDGGDPDALEAYITDVYGLNQEQWAEAAIAKGRDDSVLEIAVLRAAEGQSAERIRDTLTGDYLDVKEGQYGRFPSQAEMLGNAVVGQPINTDFIILAVCSKPVGIITISTQLLGTNGYDYTQRHFQASKPDAKPDSDYPDRIAFVQPNEDDMSIYDTTAIQSAWETGNLSGLSDYDKDIYDGAKRVLDKVVKDGMNDLEKETAIYSWVVNNINYDWRHQNILVSTPRESFTPYGGLVNRTAICLGYATTFQLLCDLAGVECITVVGAAFNSTGDHGWNMVRLGGNWYCVDATWDANYRENGGTAGREQDWSFFNVTSSEMADSNHQWDYANTPEATAIDRGQG